jgi:hypothetical protein
MQTPATKVQAKVLELMRATLTAERAEKRVKQAIQRTTEAEQRLSALVQAIYQTQAILSPLTKVSVVQTSYQEEEVPVLSEEQLIMTLGGIFGFIIFFIVGPRYLLPKILK